MVRRLGVGGVLLGLLLSSQALVQGGEQVLAPLFVEVSPRLDPAEILQYARTGPEVLRKRLVQVDFAQLWEVPALVPARMVLLNLFPDRVFTAQLVSYELTQYGYSWIGRLESISDSHVILSTAVADGILAGTITMLLQQVEFFLVEWAGNGVYSICEINMGALPGDPRTPPTPDHPPSPSLLPVSPPPRHRR